MTDSNDLFAVLFNLIGFALIFFAINLSLKIFRLQKRGIKTTGKIVEIIKEKSSDEDMHLPVIEFLTKTGEVVKVRRDYDDYRNQKVNQIIKIIYDPEDPQEMVTDTFFDKYFTQAFLLILGLGFIIAANTL